MVDQEAALLTDIFEIMKTYVPKAEISMAAEELIRVFDDHGLAEEIQEDPTLDSKLKKAIKSHFEMDCEDEYEGYDDE